MRCLIGDLAGSCFSGKLKGRCTAITVARVGLLILLALVAAPANGTQVNGGMLIATSTSSLGFYGGQPAYLTAGLISVNNPGSTLVVQAGSSPGEFQAERRVERVDQRRFRTGHRLRHPGRYGRKLHLRVGLPGDSRPVK